MTSHKLGHAPFYYISLRGSERHLETGSTRHLGSTSQTDSSKSQLMASVIIHEWGVMGVVLNFNGC